LHNQPRGRFISSHIFMLEYINTIFSFISNYHNITIFLVFLLAFLEWFIFLSWISTASWFLVFIFILVKNGLYNFYLVFLLAFLWSFLWNIVSYFLWVKFWKRALKKWLFFIKPEFFKKGIDFFSHYNGYLLFFWRIIPWIKENISFLMWVFHLNKIKFFILNFMFLTRFPFIKENYFLAGWLKSSSIIVSLSNTSITTFIFHLISSTSVTFHS